MQVLIYFIAFVIGWLLLGVLALYLSARLLRAPQVSLRRALFAKLGILAISIVLNLAVLALPESVGLLLGALVVTAFVSVALIRVNFEASPWRSIGIWLMYLIPTTAVYFALAIPTQLFVFEAFQQPTMTMAPTILGPHRRGVCPECGGYLALPIADSEEHQLPGTITYTQEPGICLRCRHIHEARPDGPTIQPRDRFFVEKLPEPQRWDLVVFEPPHVSQQKYVKRLVGLPGDTLELRGGELRINGEPAVYAPDMVGLSYDAGDKAAFLNHLNIDGSKVTLQDDEYFVLGDFTTRSSDSREFGPIKTDSVTGVVTLIYWPPARWRVLR